MKCPECGHAIRGSQVSFGTKCPGRSCSYAYVFSKRTRPRLTDRRFRALVRQVSGNGTRWYTFDELWGAFAKGLYEEEPSAVSMTVVYGILALLLLAATVVVWPEARGGALLLLIVPMAVGVVYLARLPRNRFKPPTQAGFLYQVEKWERSGKTLEKWIREPMLQEPPPEWDEDDIYLYGPERLMIVERDILVDWLVLNGWHTQTRTLVVAESGYPRYIAERAEGLLRDNPKLPVLLFHDSTTEGQEMEKRLRAGGGPLALSSHPATDLGITTRDVKRLKRLRHLAPKRRKYELPADAIGFRALSPALAAAVQDETPLSELLEERPGRGRATPLAADGGGFG